MKKTRDQYDLNLFFETAADMLCIAGFDGYFKRINPAMTNLLGYSEYELKSKPISEFIFPDDRSTTDKFRHNLSDGKQLLNFENRYLTKEGETIWFSWTSIPDSDRRLIYAVAKNITHTRKLSDDRNQLISNLTETNSHLKQLTFSTSHDLRSPLGNIIGILSILDFSKIEDDETRELLGMVNISAEKMSMTLDNQIETIQESERLSIDIRDVNLDECLRSTTESIKSFISTSKTEFKKDFSAFDTIRFNKTYMESIFLNLITNSIRYSKTDQSPIISIKTAVCGGSKILIFSDNGIGMDMNKVKGKIFGFSQTFHNHKESKGIGLYLVSNHIQALGGSVHVDSEVDRGTTFTLSFAE